MQVRVKPGKYILAVSGGVDSIVLLDLLLKNSNVELIVSHFNHGIREESAHDAKFVEKIANNYGLKFELGYGKLGPATSEDKAREARYKFLKLIRDKHKANAIITAHHQDDLIETVFINILRGTGRRGLTAIQNNSEVIRPLLSFSKKEIYEYAKINNISWVEDSSNDNTEYLRNYVRKYVMPKLTDKNRKNTLNYANAVANNTDELDNLIAAISHNIAPNGIIQRSKFSSLPTNIENELVMFMLRENGLKKYDKKTINKLVMTLKTGAPRTKHNVSKNLWLNLESKTAKFTFTS